MKFIDINQENEAQFLRCNGAIGCMKALAGVFSMLTVLATMTGWTSTNVFFAETNRYFHNGGRDVPFLLPLEVLV